MDSIMSLLPNDIIITILKERRIMKQNDKYKKNYNYVLKEIISLDKKCWGNLIKSYYEKSRNNGQRILREIKYKKNLINENREYVGDQLTELFEYFEGQIAPILKLGRWNNTHKHTPNGGGGVEFVETSSDESSDEE